jgi:hypothetical protein
MAKTRLPLDNRGHPIQILKFGEVQSVAFDGTATTIATAVESQVVRVVADLACHVLINDNPTAATTDTFLPANTPEYVQTSPSHDIVSVIGISSTASSRLYVTEAV